MLTHAIRLILLSGWVLTTACGGGPEAVRVTIDMRCGADARCPSGFECIAETEHGPPTTLCESQDPAASCPPGFEATRGYGLTFCTPHPGISSRSRAPLQLPLRARHPGHDDGDALAAGGL